MEGADKAKAPSGDDKAKASSADDDLSSLLDSCLDDFKKPVPSNAADSTAAANLSTEQQPPPPTSADPQSWPDEFQQFTSAMSDLINDPGELCDIQNWMGQLAGSSADLPPPDPEAFRQSLAEAMQAMAHQAGSLPEAGDIADLMGGMGMGGGGPEGAGEGDPMGFMPMMQGVMMQLMSKEMLYPAIKEIAQEYPKWLGEKEASLKPEEFANYKAQCDIMCDICKEFEKEDVNSEEAKKLQFEKVLSMMQKMQSHGNPPKELVAINGDSAPFDELGNLQIPGVSQQCAIM